MRKIFAALAVAAAVAVPLTSVAATSVTASHYSHQTSVFNWNGVVPGGVLNYSSYLTATAS